MSKLSPHLGKDITERILLKRFTELCSSEMFYVRKLSTAHFGYYCLVISRETFEKTILPCYLALCQDEIWGVRKMCADVIVYISAVCPTQLRYDLLAPTFAKLLGDECRWVRLSAYQTLGAFIATFADPPLIKIDTNSSGDLILINNNGDEFNPGATFGFSTINSIYMKEDFGFNNVLKQNYDENNGGAQLDDWMVKLLEDCEEEQKKENSCGGGDSKKEKYISQHEDDLLLYSDLNYWYTRPPPLDLQLSVETLPSIGNQANVSLEDIVTDHLEEMYATINLNESKLPPGGAETPSSDIKGDNLELTNVSDSNSTVNSLKPVEEKKEPPQKIVPQDLLDSYIAMARSENNLENDMSFFCAYSLPAVLLTLGRDNWPLLKSTLDNLAGHVSYKVRRSIASSLHEIGTILGTELASKDLSPLFEGFLKDLDEVRIRILTNLSAFLQLIDEEQRIKFLPKLDEFLRVDYAFNWRFHETLAQQLTECVPLFQPADVVKYIRFSEALMTHNVAVVRDAALILVARIVKHIYKDRSLTSSYLSVIAERFAHSKKWKLRQTFACLCAEILARDAMEPEEFASLLLPHLLDLSWDPVANVRLVVARCIVNHIIKKEFFADPQNEKIDALQTVLRRLQADKDRDVRMLAELPL
ncbi:hypothetical protein ABEB36_001909 [Hypothenemus hampei]|uniref:Serine/threonine-protein phosphatase 4 regulatory subunit 1 n=1 Tax=Hypothenemus hampei TaxID=57062 RepID=A0ABD1FJ98_HYPHA